MEEGKSLGCRELWCLQRNLKDLTEKQRSSCYYIFRLWIKDYTSSKELKAVGKEMVHMKQGCKTTYEERAEITIPHCPLDKAQFIANRIKIYYQSKLKIAYMIIGYFTDIKRGIPWQRN